MFACVCLCVCMLNKISRKYMTDIAIIINTEVLNSMVVFVLLKHLLCRAHVRVHTINKI